LAGLTLILLLATTNGIGLTYDEPVYASVSLRNWGWFRSLAQSWARGHLREPFSRAVVDRYWYNRGPTQAHRDLQPPLVKILCGLTQTLFGSLLPGSALRLPSMLLFALLVALVYRFLATTVDRSSGLFAALALLTMPRVFGHAHLLTLDVPMATMTFLTTVLFWKTLTTGSWRWTVALGLGYGLTLGTKMNAIVVPLPLFGWALWVWRSQRAEGRKPKAESRKLKAESRKRKVEDRGPGAESEGRRAEGRGPEAEGRGQRAKGGEGIRNPQSAIRNPQSAIRNGGQAVLAMFVLAPLIFVLTWPWLWYDFGSHLREYFDYHLHHYPVSVTYFGRIYQHAPWHYPFVMAAITTPTMVLLLVVGGLGGWGVKGLRDWLPPASCLLLLSALFHLLPFALPGTPKYNGIRLFLPAFPFLAGLAGIGFGRLSAWLGMKLEGWEPLRDIPNVPLKVTVVLGLFLLLPGVVGIARLHPYHLSYYNALIGGLKGAVRHGFEPTYWGETYLSAVPFFNAQAPPGARIYVRPPGATATLQVYQNLGLLRADLQLTGDDREAQEADFAVFHTHDVELNDWTRTLLSQARPVHATERDGVPLLVIYDRTAWYADGRNNDL